MSVILDEKTIWNFLISMAEQFTHYYGLFREDREYGGMIYRENNQLKYKPYPPQLGTRRDIDQGIGLRAVTAGNRLLLNLVAVNHTHSNTNAKYEVRIDPAGKRRKTVELETQYVPSTVDFLFFTENRLTPNAISFEIDDDPYTTQILTSFGTTPTAELDPITKKPFDPVKGGTFWFFYGANTVYSMEWRWIHHGKISLSGAKRWSVQIQSNPFPNNPPEYLANEFAVKNMEPNIGLKLRSIKIGESFQIAGVEKWKTGNLANIMKYKLEEHVSDPQKLLDILNKYLIPKPTKQPAQKQQPKPPPDKGTNNFPGHRLQQQFLKFAGGRSEAWTHLLKVLQDIEKMIKGAIGGKWGGDPDGLPYGTQDWLSKLSGLVATGRHDRQMPDSVGRHVPGTFGLSGKQKPKIPTSLTDLNNNIPGKPETSFQDLQGRTSDAPDPKKLGSKTYPSPKKDVRPNVTITPAKDFDFPSGYDPCGKFPSEDDLTEEQLEENPMTYEKCWEAIENGQEVDEAGGDPSLLDEILDLVGKILGDEQSANEKKGEQNLHHSWQKISTDEIEHLIDFLDQLDIPMLSPEFLEELRQDLLDYHRNTYIIPEFDMRGDPLTEEDKEKGIQRIQRQGDEIKQYSPDGFPIRNQPDVSFESLFHKTLGPRIRTSPHLEDTSLFISGDEHSRVVKTLLSSADTIKYHDPDSVSSGKGNAPRLEDYPDRISPRAHSQHEDVSNWREFRNFPSQQRTSYRTSMSVQNHRDISRSTHHKSWDDPDA